MLLACLAARDASSVYRTSSRIAFSSPSIVIGYMRSENRRRMMVVDSQMMTIMMVMACDGM